jgi:hypothetical protein
MIDSEEIEMVDRQSTTGIFVDQREGRAGHFGSAAQSSGETFHKLRFAGPKLAFEADDGSFVDLARKLAAEPFGLARAIGNEGSHEAMFDVRFLIFDGIGRCG